MAVELSDHLTRAEVLEQLKIKPQTLYAYVSRGWIRSVPQSGGFTRRYVRQDVERMGARAAARSGHAPAAAAMRWGQPIIQSTITEITEAGPRYRGIPAVDLAAAQTPFEKVAALLWQERESYPRPWQADARALRLGASRSGLDPQRDLVRLLAETALLTRRGADLTAPDPQLVEARRLIVTMAASLRQLRPVARKRCRAGSVAEMILAGFGIPLRAAHVAALDAALVLSADHELSSATFVARIAASAGADLGECIAAAILTQTGLTAARAYERAEDFLHCCTSSRRARQLFQREAAAHRVPPGFNHPLYPHGDPRASYLLRQARMIGPEAVRSLEAVEIAADYEFLPSLEVGLVVLATALGLPPRSASGIFIVGRSAGWVAHIIEQLLSGALLRPRADYVAG